MPEQANAGARLVQTLGWTLGWAVITLALTAASRPLHLGPGFANPLPYAALALAMSLAGRGLRRWLGARPRAHAQPRSLLRALHAGLLSFLHDLGGFNNVVLLTAVYFLGAGPSAVLARLFGPRRGPAPQGSYWVDAEPRKKEADAYLRPY